MITIKHFADVFDIDADSSKRIVGVHKGVMEGKEKEEVSATVLYRMEAQPQLQVLLRPG